MSHCGILTLDLQINISMDKVIACLDAYYLEIKTALKEMRKKAMRSQAVFFFFNLHLESAGGMKRGNEKV